MPFEEYKQKIVSFYSRRKRLPTYSEIMSLVGFKSKNAVYKLVQKLIDAGLIARDKDGHLIPTRMFGALRVLGLIEAGFPSVAEEDATETMSLDEFLIDNKEATYMLKVKGDSMIDAGICEGDLVLVERTKSPKVGDIVIAEIDGGWTMKYLRKKGNALYLEAANKNYAPMYPEEELKISAVVKAVIRKY